MRRQSVALGLLAGFAVTLVTGVVLRHQGLRAQEDQDFTAAEWQLRWASRLLPGQGVDLDLAETRLRRGDVRGAASLLPAKTAPSLNDHEVSREALRWMILRARVDRQERRLDAALEGFRSVARTARTAREKGLGPIELRAVLGEAEVLYSGQGLHDEGEAKLAAARALAMELGNPRSIGAVLLAEAEFSWSYRRDRDRSPALLDEALRRFEVAGDEQGRARALARLGLVHFAGGDFSRHIELQEKAQALFAKIGDGAGIASTDSFLGAVFAALERYPEARRHYDGAQQRFSRLGSRISVRGVDLLIADLEVRTGQLASARRLLDDLLENSAPNMERRRILVSLGNALMHLGEPGVAAERYREAFRLDQILRPVDFRFRHVPLVMLGHAEHQTGRLDAAMVALSAARLEAISIDDYQGIATVELAMADFLDSQGRKTEVLDHLEAAVAIQATRLGATRMPFFQTQFEQAFERLRVLLFERELHSDDRTRALDTTFRLLELMRFRLHRGVVSKASPSLGRREGDALQSLRDALEAEDPEATRQAYRSLGDAMVLDRLGADSNSTRPVSRRELQALLDPATTVVAYAFAGDSVVALGIVDSYLEAVQLSLSRGELEDRIRLFMSQLESGDDHWMGLAVRLRKDLIEPLEAVGMARGGRLAILPVGALHQLAFPALARMDDNGDRVFLVEDWRLLMASSASALARDVAAERGRGVASFARGSSSIDLPAAREESLDFTRSLGGVAVTGEAATESAVREALEMRRWLHLAVHGVAESEVPLHSRLLLGAAGDHDGRLTAHEILDLRVSCDLVILSACRTGLGFPSRAADWTAADRIGLSGALLEAGAGRVVSSLLPLEDRPTAEFVAALAEHLRQDPDPVSALAYVQRQWASQHPPSVWAGFRVAGHL